MTDWARVAPRPAWDRPCDMARVVPMAFVRLLSWCRTRRGRIRLSRLSAEWLQRYEREADKHRTNV